MYFEIGCERELNPRELICVDCGQPEVKLIKTDTELSTRLNNLTQAVGELVEKVETIEANLDESGPDDTSGKRKKTVN